MRIASDVADGRELALTRHLVRLLWHIGDTPICQGATEPALLTRAGFLFRLTL
jgi:hypothetical protein